MKTFRVYVNYMVRCSANGYIDIEADSEEEAVSMAEYLGSEAENTGLEEEEIIGDTEVVDVEEL